ncbi:unnamed protein product [Didymodactylos carnosus]|uniref:WW domain-containing protein n=1 Tax=Didymodactylos carnosus TaxID=1234261 RepID=A0A8S2NWE3_9BILA|nr:unnamed protein product [Didymodactylos carnosus]CAF4021800.1 unnamed protein product [Didymodactylos carnosus]
MADSRPGGEKDAYSQQRRLSGSARPPPCSHPSQQTPQKEPHRLPARQRQAPCRASSDRIDRREGLGSAPTPAILSHGSFLRLPRQPLFEKLDGEQTLFNISFNRTLTTCPDLENSKLLGWEVRIDKQEKMFYLDHMSLIAKWTPQNTFHTVRKLHWLNEFAQYYYQQHLQQLYKTLPLFVDPNSMKPTLEKLYATDVRYWQQVRDKRQHSCQFDQTKF